LVSVEADYFFALNAPPTKKKPARAVGWGVRDLAKAASVSVDTVSRLERGEELMPRTLVAIRAALEAAGAEFINGSGVKLRA
jgi:transcriptional regulator with XRE-family HTH domain